MASYYYLIASLPTLKSDSQMPFSYEHFLAACKSSVSNDVYKRLEELRLDSNEGPLLKQWGSFYNNLMASLCKQRNIRLGKQNLNDVAVASLLIEKAVNEAMGAKNPLDAEKILLAYQFDFLDSLASMHYFDDFVLYGYALKLKLLERQNIFDQQLGKTEFKKLFDCIQQQIMSI